MSRIVSVDALARWLRHLPTCALLGGPQDSRPDDDRCTCGLLAALAASAPAPGFRAATASDIDWCAPDPPCGLSMQHTHAPASGGSERCGYWYQYDRVECGYPESDPIHDDGRLGHAFFRRPVPADTPPASPAPVPTPGGSERCGFPKCNGLVEDAGCHRPCSNGWCGIALCHPFQPPVPADTPPVSAPAASPEAGDALVGGGPYRRGDAPASISRRLPDGMVAYLIAVPESVVLTNGDRTALAAHPTPAPEHVAPVALDEERLARALHAVPRPASAPCNHEDYYGGTGWVQCEQDARAIAAAYAKDRP